MRKSLHFTVPHFLFQVKWRPVLWGIGLQFVLGVLILRWKAGYHFFRFVGDQVKVFLDYTDEGSKFVFGEEGYLLHRMAFKVSLGVTQIELTLRTWEAPKNTEYQYQHSIKGLN